MNGRVVDEKATWDARFRHAEGKKRLDEIFTGTESEVAKLALVQKRVENGQRLHATKKNWRRSDLRSAAKAQRLARRANR